MLTPDEIDALVRRIVERIRPEKVILFGSYAKGRPTSASDLDILIMADTVLPMTRRADDLLPILSGILIPVDVHVYTPEEVDEYGKDPLSFVGSVLKTGRLVFDRHR